jgi:amidase
MDELIYSSAATVARSIREKKVSSAEVVDAYIKRIEEINPLLNCVVQLSDEKARAQAKEADDAMARGELKGPLHGVPMTVKDSIATAGVITTTGTLGQKSYVPKEDATAVAKLRGAGAIMLGNTNVPDLCLAGEADNLIYGRSSNPYDLSRTPGGSSGGEGATIAAGGTAAGLGSDVGGSIRWPAHCCGIAGLMPTSGRVSRTGHWPPLNGTLDSLFRIGPMARYVEDLELVLNVISGIDWQDPHIVPMPPVDASKVDLKSLRVAFFTDNGVRSPTPETVEAVKSAAKALSDAGLVVEEARPDGIEENFDMWIKLMGADAGESVRHLLNLAGTTESHFLLDGLLDTFPKEPISAFEFSSLLVKFDDYRSTLLRFMENHDVILCPVNSGPAMAHGTSMDRVSGISYTVQFNNTDWPAAVVRGGTSNDGLPIGVQVAAAPWREDVALAVAQHLETALGGWQRPPL